MIGPWSDYATLERTDRITLKPGVDVLDLAAFHRARHGSDMGLQVLPAYAQTTATLQGEKLNRFDALGPAYHADASIALEKHLAAITSDAAAILASEGYTLLVLDGLRTVEGNYALARAWPEAVSGGLLARPGKSAHNKACAVDCMVVDAAGQALDMGDTFDSPNMPRVHRNCAEGLTRAQIEHRLLMERAFMRAALTGGLLVAPLREEFWDFRFPEDRMDLWRVLESVARCIGHEAAQKKAGQVIEEARAMSRAGQGTEATARYAFASYDAFKAKWAELFVGQEAALLDVLGVAVPPTEEPPCYHGAYNVIYDRDLPEPMKQVNATIFNRLQEAPELSPPPLESPPARGM